MLLRGLQYEESLKNSFAQGEFSLSCCREVAPNLQSYKVFVDAGWFLDIQPYANRSDGMTFQKCARAVAGQYKGIFDRCSLLQLSLGMGLIACMLPPWDYHKSSIRACHTSCYRSKKT